jgi:hypothetical protein
VRLSTHAVPQWRLRGPINCFAAVCVLPLRGRATPSHTPHPPPPPLPQFFAACGAKRKEAWCEEVEHIRRALIAGPGRAPPPAPPRPSDTVIPMAGLSLQQSTEAYNVLRQWLLDVRGGSFCEILCPRVPPLCPRVATAVPV